MGDRFEKKMKRLMKMFEKMLGGTTKSPGEEKSETDEDFETFEKSGPGFHMKIEMFNLTKPEQFERKNLSGTPDRKEAEEIEQEEEAGKLALKRFEEKEEKTEE